MAKKMALGKGIASLLQETPNQILKNSLTDNEKSLEKNDSQSSSNSNEERQGLVSIENINPNPDQPRKIFREDELNELTESIRENGIIQPIIVSRVDNDRFEIIAGERRYRAAKILGLENVPVVIKRITKKEKMVFSIIENVQRDDLNCIEEALAYLQLITEFKLTQDEVAKKIGKSRSAISNLLRILKLPREVIELIQSNKLSLGHAKVLVSLKDDSEKIKRLALMAVESHLSVRALENIINFENSKPPVKESKIHDHEHERKLHSLQELLIDLTGRKLKIKSKGGPEKGSIEFKYSNKVEFNSLFEYLTLSSEKSSEYEDAGIH